MQKEEFQKMVLVHKDRMFRYSYSLIGDQADARDAVQDVLVKLWETRSDLTNVRNIEAWCMTLVRNKSLDALKRVGRKQKSSIDLAPEIKSGGVSPLALVSASQVSEHVKIILTTLPEKQASAFRLRDMEGYSYLEISEILETSLADVKVNIFRARKALKEQMINRFGYES